MRPRLGILLSGSGTTYANLVAANLPADIVVVIGSKPGLGGLARAEALGHPTAIAEVADDVTAILRAQRVDWVVMCGWLRYWDPPADFAGKVLNIHPSLLPAFGGPGMYGRHVHTAVLRHGVTATGCTVHLVAGGYDAGPILAQAEVPVLANDTPESLMARVQVAERILYPNVLRNLL